MRKYRLLLPIICIFIAAISSDVLAGQITIIKSGNSFTSFMAGNEDYKPSPIYEEGILLGDGADNSNPIYEFILPPKTHSSGNQIDYIQVRLVGDDHTSYSIFTDARIIIGADNYEDSMQATEAWSWTDSVALGRLVDAGNESILKVTLKVNDLLAKYDLEKIEVTYGYSNVSSGILDTWQNLYTARKSFQEFKDVTVPTWDAVSTSVNYLLDGVKQCRSFAINVSNIGSSTLYNALVSANSAVDDLVEIEGTLSGSFSIIPWITSYGILESAAGPGNYYPSGIIANFDNVLPNLSTLVSNYYLYAFDGEVDADDYNQHLETALLGLRAGSGGMPDLKLGMNTAADIIKTIYNSQKTDIAEAMFYSLAPMYTPIISESDVASLPSSYLQEFSDYIDTLVLYNPVPVPDRPVLLFPANDTFAKGLVTFHWNESATATKYHLQISLNSSFSNLIYELEDSEYRTSVSFTSFTDNGSTKLYWRVKTGNSSGWSLYSDYWVFTSGCMNGDFDGDCDADFDDLAILVSHWLDTGCTSLDLCQGTDMVRSADIDFEDFAAFAKQWQKTAPEPPIGITFVSISDSGFNGYMSKYETTNAQYCQFLNDALVSGDITVDANIVYGANGSNGGEDFVSQLYFGTYEFSQYSQITYNGNSFSVRSRDGYDMSNHPVVMVSWYGATAFCNYYGYRLPTEWEWQAVADFDGTYTYGCGTTIDCSKANFKAVFGDSCNPLGLTSHPYTNPVNHYSSYGYGMNDMAGNVHEWASNCYYANCSFNSRTYRGGSYLFSPSGCRVSYRNYTFSSQDSLSYSRGFRVCR